MKISEFLQSCTASGGNWTTMLASGVKKLFPNDYDTLPEEFTFVDVINILKRNGVNLHEW